MMYTVHYYAHADMVLSQKGEIMDQTDHGVLLKIDTRIPAAGVQTLTRFFPWHAISYIESEPEMIM